MEQSIELTMGVVVTGIVVVFIALILLIIVVAIMGALLMASKKENKKADIEIIPASSANKGTAPKSDDSVVAAISAALHCVLGGNFKIKSIRPVRKGSKNISQWEMSGRQNNVLPF